MRYALAAGLILIVLAIIGTLVWLCRKRCAPEAFVSPEAKERAKARLAELHAGLTLESGSFQEEYPEQLMAMMFLEPTDRVLEIGGNIGRNSCIIASIVEPGNLLVLESDPVSAAILARNRAANRLDFGIEAAALSKVRLLQKEWVTLPVDQVPPAERGEWKAVATKTWGEIQARHGSFDTLVLDCEGAIKQILVDEPDFLAGVNKVIIENDFTDIEDYRFVEREFKRRGLEVAYSEAGGWGPCKDFFFQVFKRIKQTASV